MKKLGKVLIVLFVVAVAGLGILIYAVPQFAETMTSTTTIKYGRLSVTDNSTCYIVRNEQVYSAAHSGNLSYYISDSEKCKKNAKVMELERASVSKGEEERPYKSLADRLGSNVIYADSFSLSEPGVVCYYIDGFEAYFNPDTMTQLKYSQVSEKEFGLTNLARENALEGEPLYKVCDDSHWYIITWVGAGNLPKYTTGKTMTIVLPKGSIRVKLESITEDGDMWLLVFSCNRYYEGFTGERKLDATIITSDEAGILIDNENITTLEGTVGVYVINKNGDKVFTPIKVLSTDGVTSVVAASQYRDEDENLVNTVNNFDEILKTPEAK